MANGRSLVAVCAAAIPTAAGACCVGIGAGIATIGGTVGVALAWLSPVLLGLALIVAGGLLLRARSGQAWRKWHGLLVVASASYVTSAVLVVPLLSALLSQGGSGGQILP